jgi:hypothetical protein
VNAGFGGFDDALVFDPAAIEQLRECRPLRVESAAMFRRTHAYCHKLRLILPVLI